VDVYDSTLPTPADLDGDGMVALMNSVFEQSLPAMHGLGIRTVEMRPGWIAGHAPLAGNTNHVGTMYAGTLFSLAEMLGGALFGANFDHERFFPLVKDMQISYLRPATSDVRAEASLDLETIEGLKRDIEVLGKVEFVLEAVLTDTAGQVVATTRGIYQIRANRSPRFSARSSTGVRPTESWLPSR
jgi:thioesterase domain-containing protein